MPDTPKLDPVPVHKLGELAMTTAEAVTERFGETAMIGAIAIVVDIFATNEDGETINPIVAVGSDPRAWVLPALLGEGLARAEQLNDERQEAVDDDHIKNEDED